jgi:hypothetical protein
VTALQCSVLVISSAGQELELGFRLLRRRRRIARRFDARLSLREALASSCNIQLSSSVTNFMGASQLYLLELREFRGISENRRGAMSYWPSAP